MSLAYSMHAKHAGAQPAHTFLLLPGLLTLFLGTSIYNGNMDISSWCGAASRGYEAVPDEDGRLPAGMRTPKDMSSPALAQSPLLRLAAIKERELAEDRERAKKSLLSSGRSSCNEV
mmetsp:Transcript_45935/g.143754  ORF Transcript_45935/g.143754 Transcript_45935/m.143754 type:complete len:117 (-) Transcript_45935:222-572(-)